MGVADMRFHGQFDGFSIEFLRRGGTADPAAIFLARVGRNGFRLHWRAACKMGPDGFGKTPDVLLILTFASRGRTLSCNAALLFIAEAFLLPPFERPGFDEDSLALISPPCPAEPHDDSRKRRVLSATPRQSRIASRNVNQMIQIRTLHTERLAVLHSQEAALPQFGAAFRTGSFPND